MDSLSFLTRRACIEPSPAFISSCVNVVALPIPALFHAIAGHIWLLQYTPATYTSMHNTGFSESRSPRTDPLCHAHLSLITYAHHQTMLSAVSQSGIFLIRIYPRRRPISRTESNNNNKKRQCNHHNKIEKKKKY